MADGDDGETYMIGRDHSHGRKDVQSIDRN